MSGAEGKAEVQVSHPGQAFPFSSTVAHPQPHISQFCRFSVPKRLPLKPFRQDRLTRLPLPPSIMATSKMTSTTGAGINSSSIPIDKSNCDMDPFLKIQQLEKNLAFIRDSHALMLKDLHEEIADLKRKNRELQFELVTGIPPLPNEITEKSIENDSPEEQKEKIEKLEKEIKKLKGALKDAMKTNTLLTNQIHQLKREQQYSKHSQNRGYSKTPPDSAIDDGHIPSPCGPSPQMDEYSDTLRQIQRATSQRSGKRNDRRYRNGDIKNEWSNNYIPTSNGFHHQQHHQYQMQKSPQQHRLPRLPLRNQQNYSHQYEIEYRQRNSNTLPALKQPLVPIVDHRIDKPRKPKGPRQAKLAHQQITNG